MTLLVGETVTSYEAVGKQAQVKKRGKKSGNEVETLKVPTANELMEDEKKK